MILLANGKVITRDPEGIGYLPTAAWSPMAARSWRSAPPRI